MTIAKSTVTDYLDFVTDRIVESISVLGVESIRMEEARFLLDKLADETEGDIKNIEAAGSTTVDGDEPTIEMDVNDWPGAVTIDDLVNRYNQDVQEAFEEDDDLVKFQVGLYLTKEAGVEVDPVPVEYVKDGAEIQFSDDDYAATDELELIITQRATRFLGPTSWTITIEIVDSE